MKIVDLDYADVMYEIENETPREIARLRYPQKFLLLDVGGEVFELEISEVTDTAFYLKVKE